MEITMADPRDPGVLEVLRQHWSFAAQHTPPEDVHALDLEGLLGPDISMFSLRRDGQVLAVGALRDLGGGHIEIKSMHTSAAARGQGLGRAMLEHLLERAADRGATRVSLETGSNDPFAPARGLYESAGFEECGPFGDYPRNRGNTFMTLTLERDEPVNDGLGPDSQV